MALPPRDDPQRPYYLALRSTRLLGFVFLLFGSFAIVAAAKISFRGVPTVFMILGAMFWLLPGILYAVFAAFLKRRHEWAIVALIVLASTHGLIALVATVAAAVSANLIITILCLLWVLALAQLIQQLSKSFGVLRLLPLQGRGFEPVPLARLAPPPSIQPTQTDQPQ